MSKRKYNLALIPTLKSDEIIQYSGFFSAIVDKYQLGNNSFPHVTLCKFYAEEPELEPIWDRLVTILPIRSIELEFKDINCFSFDKTIFWISLIPNQRAILFNLHELISKSVKQSTKRFFDPHMTLINTTNPDYQTQAENFTKIFKPFSDIFKLSIGESDETGQLTKLLYQIGS